jgi:hypothetical protein
VIAQADFSAGMVRNVARDLIPESGAYDIRDGLLDDDGNVYLRGPTARLTTSQLDASLQTVWEGQFSVGRRTVGLSESSLGVIDAAGTGWFKLVTGLTGLAGGGLAAQLGEMMLFPVVAGATAGIIGYGGSRKTSSSSSATATATAGSAVVTGSGTAWLSTAEPGMFLSISGSPGRTALIKSVDSNTQVTLTTPWGYATMTGSTSLSSYVSFSASVPDASVAPGAQAVAVVGNRVAVAVGRRVRLSNTTDPATGAARPFSFDASDYHEFPADIVALAVLRDRLFVFTRAGIYVISNIALDIVDAFGNAQHRVERVSGDVVLRSPGGVAVWRDSLAVCALDGVYVLSAAGALELISRSISPLWTSLMDQQVWQAIAFRDHLFVAVSGQMLVGRLDRRVQTPAGNSAPWTRIAQGEAAAVKGLAVRDPYATPRLVGGAPGLPGSGHLLDLTGLFRGTLSAAATAVDGSGAAYGLWLETRDFVQGDGLTAAYVDRLLLDYEASNGSVTFYASKSVRATPAADPTFDLLQTVAAAGNYSTQVPRAVAVRRSTRRVAFVISTTGSCSSIKIRGISANVRERGLQR